MGKALTGEERTDEWEAWLADLDDACDEELRGLLRDGKFRPHWVWNLAREICVSKASLEDVFWLLYRSDAVMRRRCRGYPLESDFDLLQAVFRAASDDKERWFALEESVFASEMLEGDDSKKVIKWLSSIEFADPRMQAKYLSRILASGVLGTEEFRLPPESVNDFVRAVTSASGSSDVLDHMPDFVLLGLPGAFLVARAIQDGRDDVAGAVARRLSKQSFRSLLEAIPNWESNSSWESD